MGIADGRQNAASDKGDMSKEISTKNWVTKSFQQHEEATSLGNNTQHVSGTKKGKLSNHNQMKNTQTESKLPSDIEKGIMIRRSWYISSSRSL